MKWEKSILVLFCISVGYALLSYGAMQWVPSFGNPTLWNWIISSSYMWIPGVMAYLLMKKEGVSISIFKFKSLYIVHALWIPFVIVALGVVFSSLFMQGSFEPLSVAAKSYHLTFFSSPLLNALCLILCLYGMAIIASLTCNFILVLGEEFFLRGYLWEKMRCLGFWKAAWNIGLLWGIWYTPMIVLFGYNYPHHRLLGVIWMMLYCLLASPLYLYLRIQGKSIGAPAVLHGMMNAFCPLCVVFFPEGHELLIAPLGVGGMLALLVVNGWFLLPQWKRNHAQLQMHGYWS